MNALRLTLLLLLLQSLLTAQNALPLPGGARGLALGGAGLTFQDVQSGWTNPAGLAQLQGFGAAVYGEQRFLLSEIRQTGAMVALPVTGGALGLSLGYFGFEAYNEQRVGLAYARLLSPNLQIGGQLLAFRTQIPEYGSATNVSFELGLQARVSPVLWVAARAYNPIRQSVIEGEDLPSLMALGLQYRPSNKVSVLVEAEKDIAFPVRVRTGLEYHLIPALQLRLGLATEPFQYTFGLGIQAAPGWRIDLAAQQHQYLGLTPAVGVVYAGKGE
ncbi:MAG: hypothetical protein KDC54_21275 [Lewinella sp.]|nr:hypothetical protein [Lewinella sp.]